MQQQSISKLKAARRKQELREEHEINAACQDVLDRVINCVEIIMETGPWREKAAIRDYFDPGYGECAK